MSPEGHLSGCWLCATAASLAHTHWKRHRHGPRLSTNPPPACRWCFPAAGVAAANANAQVWATVAIFVISGLLLQRGETLAAVRSTAALAYGLTAILAITPLVAFGVLRLPLAPPEMALGLAVFCCMPTTLSTGVTLTTASNGNAAVALLLTVASNLLSVSLSLRNGLRE